MKILHTADWHIGRHLYGRKRYDEFTAFLDWLRDAIQSQSVNTLLIAGDIFDTSTPTNRSQQLYYNFLCSLKNTSCRHVVIIAGNHDSPTFLEAPKDLLKHLNVHVVGSITDSIDDEIILLNNNNRPELIVCAVPYLRDKDIRVSDEGETPSEKDNKLLEGIHNHYNLVCNRAKEIQSNLEGIPPIIAMGHLFTQGGSTTEGDGVRELYAGNLAHVDPNAFPNYLSYSALGHLHSNQKVGGRSNIQYSGSPLPMGFGECSQTKSVNIVDLSEPIPKISPLHIPAFQKLCRIKGDWPSIEKHFAKLKEETPNAWVEVIYESSEAIPNLHLQLEKLTQGTSLEILRCHDQHLFQHALTSKTQNETLDDLTPGEVFQRCLEKNNIPPEQRAQLVESYNEILQEISQEDPQAE